MPRFTIYVAVEFDGTNEEAHRVRSDMEEAAAKHNAELDHSSVVDEDKEQEEDEDV